MDYNDLVNRSQGWCSIEKMEALRREIECVIVNHATDHITAVELGVFGARSLIPVADAFRVCGVLGMVYGIDPWHTGEAVKGYDGENASWWGKVDLPEILKQAHILTGHYHFNDLITFVTSTSNQAAKLFSKIHFFHCDGQHVLEQFKADMDNYLPKVVSGCPVIIDDVNWCGGKDASNYVERCCDYKYSVGDCAFYVKK